MLMFEIGKELELLIRMWVKFLGSTIQLFGKHSGWDYFSEMKVPPVSYSAVLIEHYPLPPGFPRLGALLV